MRRGAGWSLLLYLLASPVLAEQLRVRITPENPDLKANVEGYIGELEDKDRDELLRLSRIAGAQARQAAEALGYYRAQIRTEVSTSATPRLTVRIDAGEPVRLRNVTVRIEGPAASQAGFQKLDLERLRPGQVLNHGDYEAVKGRIESQASRFGYFAGRFVQQRIQVDPVASHADIELIYRSGERHRFGEIAFTGKHPFEDQLLRRMLPFEPGTPYDSELIAELHQNLQGSGYFESIRVDAAPSLAQAGVIPVEVRLDTRKPRTFGVGLGYSTDVGPRGRFEWTRHWRNPQGHSYGIDTEWSAPRQNVGLWYDMPGDKPLTDKLRLAGGYQYEELADTDSLSKLISIGPEWHSLRPNGWQRVLSLKWQHEEYRLGDDEGISTLLLPGVGYSYLKSDNRLDPNRGYRVQFEIAGAQEGLGSDASVVHGEVSLRGLITLAERHRFLGRVQFGGTETDDYSSVPPSLRFFAGGDQSVRGYDYQSLSPTNSQGDRVGGRYMLAVSGEYQFSLTPTWRLATFADHGNSFNSLEIPSLKSGVGFGVRWVSPVGPLRLDLAHPLDGNGGLRLHFSMGPEL
ncbi:MAG TPA: autotransporter assembly complex family protein [Pseudomonas sp.]|uniref:autotransporter assembly complex protein TamA n=1 Tax=Pseudomonas sp. TaxID=306 RepID=UPI002C0A8726|nr:autotransporter assembly complex family protein [Pseudomonas sp.]HTO20570.1 autotransporter assembly complex family protein [Pseudomonas sp.]